MLTFDVLTLFPEMIEGFINSSILKKAIDKELIKVNIINFRDFSTNKHHTVDDYAYGGGAGMLISVEPIVAALKSINGYQNAKKILTSASGSIWNETKALNYSKEEHIIIICGHYEGIDARILNYIDDEVSIGDYVLTGGELPAGIIIDSISRLVKGVISDDSIIHESYNDNLLEYPQYTHPQEFEGLVVPDVLISGHHANIEKFKRYESLKKTYLVRPDLLKKVVLSDNDKKMLEEIIKNEKK